MQESSHALVTLPLIAAGLGVAIVPEALRRIAIDNVAFVDLEDAAGEPLSYAVALAARRAGESGGALVRRRGARSAG